MKRIIAALLCFPILPLILLAATTQIDWNTQVKNKPSLWNDPGSGTLLKRTGAFTFAAAVAGDLTTLLGFTPENAANKGAVNGYAPLNGSSQVPAANLPAAWNDPGSGTILKRTGSFTFSSAAGSDLPTMVASGASHSAGAAPDPGGSAGTTHFLREDATWAVPPGGLANPVGIFQFSRGSLTLSNGANENVSIGSSNSYFRTSGPTGAFSIGGFVAGSDGQLLILSNISGQQMTINNADGSSTAANRIYTQTGANVVLRAGNSAAWFIYNTADSGWLVVATW